METKTVSLDGSRTEHDRLPDGAGEERRYQNSCFSSVARTLYRAQGRRWIGSYQPEEVLCGACFLARKGYLGDKHTSDQASHAATAPYTPAPEDYVSACPPEIFDTAYFSES
jgi:hypothetical protein